MQAHENIHAVVAKVENEMITLVLVIDNRPRTFVVARHVAAAMVREIVEALSQGK